MHEILMGMKTLCSRLKPFFKENKTPDVPLEGEPPVQRLMSLIGSAGIRGWLLDAFKNIYF